MKEDEPGELVDGVLEQEEMPSFLHEIVVLWLAAVLGAWAHRRGAWVAGSETKIAVGARRGRKADVSLFVQPDMPSCGCRRTFSWRWSRRGRGTRSVTVSKKLSDYAAARVRHYYVVGQGHDAPVHV